MFRLLNEQPRGIFSMLKMRIGKKNLKPGLLGMSIHTGSMGEEKKSFKPSRYVTAARGESVCNLATPFRSYDDCQAQQLMQLQPNTDHI